jgi:hypothetical protein
MRRWCDFVVLSGDEIRVQRIDRDEEYCQQLQEKVTSFWKLYTAPRLISHLAIGNKRRKSS